MKQASLDALLIDRSLGELSPEAAELLDEFLSTHPSLAPKASELEQTVKSARDAVAREHGVADAPRLERWSEIVSSGERTPAWVRYGSLAACLAAGLALGWGLRLPSKTSSFPSGAVELVQRQTGAPMSPRAASSPSAGLWSASHMVGDPRTRSAAGSSRHRLAWDEHSLKPRLETNP